MLLGRRPTQRSQEMEILDRDEVSEAQLLASLRAMGRVNRLLAGVGPLHQHIRSVASGGLGGPLTLLDLGVGLGDVPRDLRSRLAKEGVEVRWVGVDRNGRVLPLARDADLPVDGERSRAAAGLVCADVRRLPFADDAFDVAISTLTLHHLSEESAVAFLREAARVARRGIFVSDLERGRLHYLGARVLGATWWRTDPVTRHDGPLSVLRSYTRRELEALAAQVPLREVRVRRHFPFRLVLAGEPG